MGKRYELLVKERREAVLSLLRREEPGAVITRRYDVSEASLYHWRDEFLAASEVALAGSTRNGAITRDRQIAELEQQIEKRDQEVKDRDAYNVMRTHCLLHKPQVRVAELYQAACLFELLPQDANDLWQMDVTYILIPGYSWWYVVTVIDYYSCYLSRATARWRSRTR